MISWTKDHNTFYLYYAGRCMLYHLYCLYILNLLVKFVFHDLCIRIKKNNTEFEDSLFSQLLLVVRCYS